jgi:hypothetical protein
MQNVNECANCQAFHNRLEEYKQLVGNEDKYVDQTDLPKIEKYFRDCLACKKNLQAGLCSFELKVDQLNDDKTNKRYKACATFDHYDQSRALIEKKVTKLELQKLQGQNIKTPLLTPVTPVLQTRPPNQQYYQNQYPVAAAYQNQRAPLTPQQQQQLRIQQQRQQQEQIRAQRQRQMNQFNQNVNFIQGRVAGSQPFNIPQKYKFKVTL